MIILTIYLIFAVINIIIGSILAYIDYNKGKAITLQIIITILYSSLSSLFGTIMYIVIILDENNDMIIFQKSKRIQQK